MKIRFVSKNELKLKEVQTILGNSNFSIVPTKMSIKELQTEDVRELVTDKLLQAFKKIGHPVFVEHTGLYIDSLSGFPGGLTQIFWDKLEADTFTSLFGVGPTPSVTAKTMVAYCDGKKMHFFEGAVKGTVSTKPKGDRAFQWDCVFIPEGNKETFAEMGDRKNEISMRKIALDNFREYLEGISNNG